MQFGLHEIRIPINLHMKTLSGHTMRFNPRTRIIGLERMPLLGLLRPEDGGVWMESNLVPRRDLVYSQAATPVSSYLHTPYFIQPLYLSDA